LKYLEEVGFGEVLEQWALREGKTLVGVIRDRNPLINTIPIDTRWFKVRIHKGDLRFVQVINEPASWNILSCWKVTLNIVVKNCTTFSQKPPNIPNVQLPNGIPWPKYFRDLLDSLANFRAQAGNQEHNLTLILLASSREGPFTILEGNHTAVALYYRHFVDHPEIRWRACTSYVGISISMPFCLWYHANTYSRT
jgi:hypothetical protein